MRVVLLVVSVLASVASCGFPETRMVPVADYGAARKAKVSAAPAYTAGTNYVKTTSPDGATVFVCEEGGVRPGAEVPPHARPAC